MSNQQSHAAGLIKAKVPETWKLPNDEIASLCRTATEPVVLRSAVSDWTITKHAAASHEDLLNYLLEFDAGASVALFDGPRDNAGRIFYDETYAGLNCEMRQLSVSEALNVIFANAMEQTPSLKYMGSTPIASHFSGLDSENQISIEGADAYIWIGGPSRISAHYDLSENLACVVAGKRQFILFPPDQLKNLYVGPLDFSPAGQPISLVDFHDPDYERFPRFREALEHALIADLEPGDAIFIPSMWQHHVEALSAINVLVNYWFRRTPEYLGAPMSALEHAMMTLRDLPPDQKESWREIFDYYIFKNDPVAAEHIPRHIRGILDPVSPEDAQRIRATLLNRLNS